MKRILIFVLVIFSLTSCDKKQTDEESPVVEERLRIKKILEPEFGSYTEFSYDSNDLLTRCLVYNGEYKKTVIADILYNSARLPVKIGDRLIEWNSNNTVFKYLNKNGSIEETITATLDSKNQIKSVVTISKDITSPNSSSSLTEDYTWRGDEIYINQKNGNSNGQEYLFCKLTTKNSPFKGINIALVYRGMSSGGIYSRADNQNLFSPSTKYLGENVFKYSYTYNDKDFPVNASIVQEGNGYIGEAVKIYYEYEKY